MAFVAFDQVDGHAHAFNTSVVGFQSHWVSRCSRGAWLRFFWGGLPDIPAPMMTTAAEVWVLLPTGTSGHGFEPPMSSIDTLRQSLRGVCLASPTLSSLKKEILSLQITHNKTVK